MKELKMFINGKFEENVSGKWINVLNPSTEEITCLMPDGTADDARRAIDAAAAAQLQHRYECRDQLGAAAAHGVQLAHGGLAVGAEVVDDLAAFFADTVDYALRHKRRERLLDCASGAAREHGG